MGVRIEEVNHRVVVQDFAVPPTGERQTGQHEREHETALVRTLRDLSTGEGQAGEGQQDEGNFHQGWRTAQMRPMFVQVTNRRIRRPSKYYQGERYQAAATPKPVFCESTKRTEQGDDEAVKSNSTEDHMLLVQITEPVGIGGAGQQKRTLLHSISLAHLVNQIVRVGYAKRFGIDVIAVVIYQRCTVLDQPLIARLDGVAINGGT